MTRTEIKALIASLPLSERAELLGCLVSEMLIHQGDAMSRVLADELTVEPPVLADVLEAVAGVLTSENFQREDDYESRMLSKAAKSLKSVAENLATID